MNDGEDADASDAGETGKAPLMNNGGELAVGDTPAIGQWRKCQAVSLRTQKQQGGG